MAGKGSVGPFTSVSGNGGTVTVYNSQRNANGSVTPADANKQIFYTFQGVQNWTLTKTAVLTEITHSGSQGFQQRKQVVRGGQFKLAFVWDANNVPDSDVTLDQGDEPNISLKRGLNKGFYQFPSIIETCEIVDDQMKDVIKGNISGYVNGPIVNSIVRPQGGA